MMDFNGFHDDVMNQVANRPNGIRLGQAVFNYIDERYGVARVLQMVYNVDCFYDDDMVEEFITKAWYELNTLSDYLK